MLVRKKVAWQLLLSGIAIGFFLKSSVVNSSEIQAFGFLGAEGQFNVDYLFDDNFSGKVDLAGVPVAGSRDQERKVIQENLEVLFHSFLYHPNFVKLDFGFGLVLTQNELKDFETTSGNNDAPTVKSQNEALDFNVRMSFFEKKDYPFSIFYAKKHPSINAVSRDAFVSETTRYGLNFLWNAPIKINVDAIHYDVKGESNFRVVNDQVDSSSIRAYKSFKNDGHMQAVLTHQIQSSKSGSSLSAISESVSINDSMAYDSRYNFGSGREYTFNLSAGYRQNRKSFEYNEINVTPSFNWKHSEKLKSTYRYSYSDNEYSEIRNTSHTITGGISYTEQNGFSTRFNGSGVRNEFTGATTTLYSIQNTSNYRHSFKHADLSVSASIGLNQSQSVSNFTGSGVFFSEILAMPPLNEFKQLIRTNIVSTIAEIKVEFKSELLTRDVHYKIYDRGNGKFDIELLASNLISAGDKVIVKYQVDPGQDNKFQRTNQGLTSSLQFFDYFNVFAGINQSKLSVLEGTESKTLVLNRTMTNSGAGVDYPLFDYVLLGGEIRRDKTIEDEITTEAYSEFAYIQASLFSSASLYLSRRHSIVVYTGIENTNNDRDRVAYRALLKIQTSNRTNLSLIYDDSKDVGNIAEIKENSEASIRFEWGYRKILIRATGSKSRNQRGAVLRERVAFQLNLVRTF